MKINIIPLPPERAGEAAEAERKCIPQNWPENEIRDMANRPDAVYLIAVTGSGQIAGTAGLLTAADEGQITNITVMPEFRRAGIGLRLLCCLLDKGGEKGARAFFLEVDTNNFGAIALYKKAGFEIAGLRNAFYGSADALVMAKKPGEMPEETPGKMPERR